ncbi:MAG: Uma2 family endonuclease [Cyanobacteria bacterium P01_G01_bin.54]
MVQAPVKPLTLDAFLTRPETKPASEYIEGYIFQKPMPQGKHSTLQTELASEINGVLKRNRLGKAFTELRCTFGGRSTVPDIAVFTGARIPRDASGAVADRFELAPDWTIEILSPEQSPTRVTKNILHCLANQTQMGWLIDPVAESVLVYSPPCQVEVFDQTDIKLPVPEFAAPFEVTVGELFGWLFA